MDNVDFYLYDLRSKFNKINSEKYYLSYSGGKDSHFLYWFIKKYAHIEGIEIVGCNTYMEHPEIRKRIYDNSDVVLLPAMKPFEIKEKYGIPCFSKEQDFYIYYYQKALRENRKVAKTIQQKIDGTYSKGFSGISQKARKYVKNENAHKITHLCCYYLKKKPFHDYEKESDRKAILGIRGKESALRKKQYISCFSLNGKFTPLYDLTDELMEQIYDKYKIEIPNVYKAGIKRTGCMGCPYGSFYKDTQKELRIINDSQRKFVTKLFKESYQILGIDSEE